MRRVKLGDEGHTLEDTKRLGQEDALCDYCANDDCSVGAIMRKLKVNRFKARCEVLSCASFVPVLTFQDAGGLGSQFNTFRLGGAWAERVAAGSTVSLRKVGGEEICRAEVTSVHRGLFTVMDEAHGVNNHLAIQAECDGKDFDLFQTMKQVYGGHRFNSPGAIVSVIYMRRVDDG